MWSHSTLEVTLRVHAPHNQILEIWIIVVIDAVGKYMLMRYLDPQGKLPAALYSIQISLSLSLSLSFSLLLLLLLLLFILLLSPTASQATQEPKTPHRKRKEPQAGLCKPPFTAKLVPFNVDMCLPRLLLGPAPFKPPWT